jgi:predicted ABC-type ATPase
MADAANEFFYLDDTGTKQDAELHNPILRAIDQPVDQKVMKPIRERNRAKWLAEQQAAQQEARRKSQWQRAKARAKTLLKYDPSEPRDDQGKWSSGGGGGDKEESEGSSSPHAKDPTSASSLLRIEKNVTVSDLLDKVPGSREQDLMARARLRTSRETDKIYKLPNGHYAPDRLPTHRAIVNKLMPESQVAAAVPKAGEQPVLHILGGRGGSGKGWFTGKSGTIDPKTAVYINNDDVKEALPEYKGYNAGHTHEEASDIAEGMEKYARDNKLNVIVDATLKSGPSLEKRIELYKKAGYKIHGHYMYASPATAAERALGRFVSGNAKNGKGRFVPPEYSLASITNEHTFDSNRDKMDHWEVYDNSGDSPKLHSRSNG